MDTPNVPKPGAIPGKIGKAVKGHKPVVYVGVVALALVLAWYIRKREQDAALTPTPETIPGTTSPDPLSSGYSAYGGAATYDGTQGAATGAYYGYSDPSLGGQVPGGISVADLGDLISALGGYYAYAPMPVGAPTPDTGPVPGTPPTGGGPQARIAPQVAHAVPVKATAVASIPKGGTSVAIHDHPAPPDPKYPFLSTRGWYAVVVNPKGHKPGRYHKYANGLLEKVG